MNRETFSANPTVEENLRLIRDLQARLEQSLKRCADLYQTVFILIFPVHFQETVEFKYFAAGGKFFLIS